MRLHVVNFLLPTFKKQATKMAVYLISIFKIIDLIISSHRNSSS